MEISTLNDEKTILKQKGEREYLLCKKCEIEFSKYERSMSQIFYHGEREIIHQNRDEIIVENINYSFLKLFQLSILWRASISNLRIFKDVELGTHEEKIRTMLLNKNPGRFYEYGCLLFSIKMDNEKLVDGLILSPEYYKAEGFGNYRFTFGGLIWNYVVSSHNHKFELKDYFLSEDGRLTIRMKKIQDIKYIMELGFELSKQGKL
ncbi:MAG: hypothetical protein V3V16_11140 [Melioribacteraceae bacterium]